MRQAEKQRSPLGTVIAFSTVGALAFVWLGLALAWGAAVLQWGRTAGATWTGWEAAGVAIGLGWEAVCAALLAWKGKRWSDRMFLGVATGLALAVGLGWAWTTRGMGNWPMDSGFFRWFLEQLATGGYNVETLQGLTGNYDYGAWATRAWPLYYPLRLCTGVDGFGLAVQCVQAVLVAACVPLVWRTAKLLCGGKAARWAVAGWLGMPGFGMQAVGLNHQVLGMFGYLAATCLLVEWVFGGGGIRKKIALAAGMGLLAGLVCFEGSVWRLFLLGAGALLVLECFRPGGHRVAAVCALVAMVVIPGRIARMVTRTVLTPAREANPESMNGGNLAFMARGWDFGTGGEYSDAMQTVDVLTPRAGKDRVFKAYLAAQCAYNGQRLLARLFPEKLAKFMLAGYASMAEEVLWANGAERTGRIVRGMRVGWFVLMYAPLMVWGLWRLSRRVGAGDGRVAWLVLPVAMFGAAVMVAGETSPRYAMPVQALLIMLGACGWAQEQREEQSPVLKHPFAAGVVLVLAGYGAFAGGILGARGLWARYALADMREVVLDGGHPSGEAYQAPFEAVFPEGEGAVTWSGRGGGATVYLRGRSWREKGQAEVSTREGEWLEVELPVRVEVNWEEDAERRLAVRRKGEAGEVWVGYADVWKAVEPWEKSETGKGCGGELGGGEGPVEVVAASGAGDVEDFAGKGEGGMEAAGEGLGGDFGEGDAAGGGHAFGEGAGGSDGEGEGGQGGGEGSGLGGGETGQWGVGGDGREG